MTIGNSPELEPCPFCGGTKITVFEADDIGGWLAGCCAQTWGDTKAEAITAWNTRTPDRSADAELREALIAAKQEMWLAARANWTMADFKNWATIQQIDAVLEKADGKPRTEAAIAKATGAS